METSRRQEILARIEAWLREWPDEEPLPAGLDPALVEEVEPVPDLAELAGAVLASGRDVQIQGKALKRLQETLEAGQARREGENLLLEEMLDLHDRLSRCLAEARKAAARLSLPGRWTGAGRALQGVARGVEMTLERLEEVLGRADVRPFASTGKVFDPQVMRAVDTVPAGPKAPPGRVAATVRTGFIRGSTVLRPAEVKVAK